MLTVERGLVIPSADTTMMKAALKTASPYVLLTDVTLATVCPKAREVVDAAKRVVVHVDMASGLHPIPPVCHS
ncbi:hypothetical protein KB1_14500 [Cutibacterium modestum]|jgi:glycerol-3-phosphate responsive antiterminator|uniref:Uncharacterized protein n=2 Tax=Cutibacterium modestum TaxID=2559073 RepID=A0AAD1NVU5_9ACTN|nr:hypothetical protein HMPREF9607_01965 [Cutibacterium modestum HL044PA1]BCY25460.1 hypothetical protein KB1_14500 [Cutibacterium modestum]